MILCEHCIAKGLRSEGINFTELYDPSIHAQRTVHLCDACQTAMVRGNIRWIECKE